MTHIPIIAMELQAAALSSRSGVIGILAINNTMTNPAVQKLCGNCGRGMRITLQACPGLAEQVERVDLHDAVLQRRHAFFALNKRASEVR